MVVSVSPDISHWPHCVFRLHSYPVYSLLDSLHALLGHYSLLYKVLFILSGLVTTSSRNIPWLKELILNNAINKLSEQEFRRFFRQSYIFYRWNIDTSKRINSKTQRLHCISRLGQISLLLIIRLSMIFSLYPTCGHLRHQFLEVL